MSIGPSIINAVRVINRNSCGSGSICGEDTGGTYILTNAHVAGSTPGRNVRIHVQQKDNSAPLEKTGVVIMAGYSSRIQMDWAVVYIEGWSARSYGIQPVKLSKQKPTRDRSYYTKGSPRCVWPLRATDIRPVDISPNMALWKWLPDAIGGQSGSGVWSDDDNLQYGLLTWSYGSGHGAGQQTAEIYKQYVSAITGDTVTGLPMVDGLKPLPYPYEDDEVFDDEMTVDREGLDDPVLMEGVHIQLRDNITDLPIWYTGKPDPEPEPDPDKPNPKPTDPGSRAEFIEHLRATEEFYRNERRKLEEKQPPTLPKPDPDSGDDDGCSDGKIFGL